jgi:hypothetical protein
MISPQGEGVQKGCSGKEGNEYKGCDESEGVRSASVGKCEQPQKETEIDAKSISTLRLVLAPTSAD